MHGLFCFSRGPGFALGPWPNGELTSAEFCKSVHLSQVNDARRAGHNYIEYWLYRFLIANFPKAKSFVANKPFSFKLELAHVTGIFSYPEMYKSLLSFNEIRNSLAHEIGNTKKVGEQLLKIDVKDVFGFGSKVDLRTPHGVVYVLCMDFIVIFSNLSEPVKNKHWIDSVMPKIGT